MSGEAVPPWRKKPYPYQDTRVFDISSNTTRKRKPECCWYCESNKEVFQEIETVILLGVKQVSVCIAATVCAECNAPIYARCSIDWPGIGYAFMIQQEMKIIWRGRHAAKWRGRKAKLEREEKELEARLAELKRQKAEIR